MKKWSRGAKAQERSILFQTDSKPQIKEQGKRECGGKSRMIGRTEK